MFIAFETNVSQGFINLHHWNGGTPILHWTPYYSNCLIVCSMHILHGKCDIENSGAGKFVFW